MKIAGKVKRSFSKSAKNYARHAGLQREVSGYLVRDFALCTAPRTVLDIGCGTGFTSEEAAQRWPTALVAALDIAYPMAAETRRNGTALAVAADAVALPFREGSFDVAVSSLAFQWLFSPGAGEGLFHGISRVLKSGGTLCFSTLAPGTLAELRKAYDQACRQCTGRGADFLPMPDAQNIERMMANAGFAAMRFKSQTIRRPYENVDGLFEILRGIGATAPGRPQNPPRRDVLDKTRLLYPSTGGLIHATYEVQYFQGVKP